MNDPLDLVYRWLAAVCSHDVTRVLSQYTSDAVLCGTFAKEIKQGLELEGYFREFLARPGLCGEINSFIVQETGSGPVVSGTYTFAWDAPSGMEAAQARYTFVFVEAVGGWRILNHHSSAVPA